MDLQAIVKSFIGAMRSSFLIVDRQHMAHQLVADVWEDGWQSEHTALPKKKAKVKYVRTLPLSVRHCRATRLFLPLVTFSCYLFLYVHVHSLLCFQYMTSYQAYTRQKSIEHQSMYFT